MIPAVMEFVAQEGDRYLMIAHMGFPSGSVSKESACNAGDPGLIPGSGRSLEKEIATYSSTLAWRSPWTEEPGRLQSMGLQSWTRLCDFRFHTQDYE